MAKLYTSPFCVPLSGLLKSLKISGAVQSKSVLCTAGNKGLKKASSLSFLSLLFFSGKHTASEIS